MIKIRIISKFKDYYDYIAHVYGADPSIVYKRTKLENCSYPLMGIQVLPDYIGGVQSAQYEFKWLSVAAKLYTLVRNRPTYPYDDGYSTTVEPYMVLTKDHPTYSNFNKRNYFTKQSIAAMQGVVNNEALALTKLVGTPVFSFTNSRRSNTVVDENIPILGNIGLAAIYPADQLYQDLAYFICNTMNDSPDMAKPSVITDTEKICSHGFDLKQSFRHRK